MWSLSVCNLPVTAPGLLACSAGELFTGPRLHSSPSHWDLADMIAMLFSYNLPALGAHTLRSSHSSPEGPYGIERGFSGRMEFCTFVCSSLWHMQ